MPRSQCSPLLVVCVTVQDKWGSVVGCVCVDGAVLVCLPGAAWCDGQVTDGWTVAVRPLRHHLRAEQKQSCLLIYFRPPSYSSSDYF